MNFQLKPAREDQIADFPALAKRTILKCYPDIIGLDNVTNYANSGIIEKYFEDNWQTTLCIYDGDALIGMGTHLGNEVHLMVIVPEYHRVGAGTVLLNALEAMLFGNHDTIYLDCFEKNIQGVNFYHKNGWSVDHRKTDEYGIDYVVMNKHK